MFFFLSVIQQQKQCVVYENVGIRFVSYVSCIVWYFCVPGIACMYHYVFCDNKRIWIWTMWSKAEKDYNISPLTWGIPNPKTLNVYLFFCRCFCPIHWSQVLSRESRCSWSSADRRCSNYIWVITTFCPLRCSYIRCMTAMYIFHMN